MALYLSVWWFFGGGMNPRHIGFQSFPAQNISYQEIANNFCPAIMI